MKVTGEMLVAIFMEVPAAYDIFIKRTWVRSTGSGVLIAATIAGTQPPQGWERANNQASVKPEELRIQIFIRDEEE